MLWELLMGEQGYPHFQAWLRFLKEHHKRAINKVRGESGCGCHSTTSGPSTR